MISRVKKLFFGSIRKRLIFGIALVHALMMSAFILDLNERQKNIILHQQQQQANFLVQNLSRSSAAWLVSRDIIALQELINAQNFSQDLSYAMAIDPQGLILAHTDKSRRGQYVTDLPAKPVLTYMHRDSRFVDVMSPAIFNGQQVGWIRLGIEEKQVKQEMQAISRAGTLYTLIAIVIGVIVALVVSKRLTSRLKAIYMTAGNIMTGDFGERVPVEGTDETSILATRFNEMLDTIENNEEALKASYQSLSRKERLLHQAQTVARLGSWDFDIVNQTIACSEETYHILGVGDDQELTNYEAFISIVHPDDRAGVLQIFQQGLISGPDSVSYKFRIIHMESGEIRHIKLKSERTRNAAGELVRTRGFIQDITDEVIAAEKLVANEARLRTILKTASDGITIIDSSGTLIDASDSFLLERGLDESCIGHIKIWDWDPYLPRERIEEMTANVIDFGDSRVFETKHRHRNGHEFWVEVHARGVEILGQKMLFASSRDITERKEAEAEREKLQEQLLQSQKMESLGQLTGGIAHDFNNMLGAILGYSELLKSNLQEIESTDREQGYVDNVLSAGNRAKELIAQLMLFSRFNQNSNSDVPCIHLKPVVTEVIKLLQSSIPSSIDVSYFIEDDNIMASILPVQLHQILLNLAINARDAISSHGQIDITVSRKQLQEECYSCHNTFKGDYVILRCQDTGQGISEDNLAKIFDPFFTTKDVGKGTGMGLSVVHGLVHSLGGHITISSERGNGTIIQIYLPVSELKHAEHSNNAVNANSKLKKFNSKHVMVVDDEDMVASMLQDVLEQHDLRVTQFTNPVEALSSFKHEPAIYDMVITDQTMPELSGLEMSKSIIKLRPDIPVILCTGFSTQVDEKIARDSGITGFMHKPLKMSELVDKIDTIFEKQDAG